MARFIFITMVSFLLSCNSSTQQNSNSTANQAIIERYFQHFNQHEWQKMAEMYIEQPEMKDPAYGIKNVKMSRADILKKYTELNQIIPDIHDNVMKMYHSGNQVIVEFESSGTAPDGSKFVLPICTIFEITDGKITKDFTYYDNFDDQKK